jgi:hypothetical protein
MTPRATTITFSIGLGLAALVGQWLLGSPLLVSAPIQPSSPDGGQSQLHEKAPDLDRGAVSPHRPEGFQPEVATGLLDYHGNPVGVSCMTCHATRAPNRDRGLAGAVPTEFHQGLVYAHANQSCLSCHHAEDYGSLRLADGRKLAFGRAQNLCAQCHGPQTRDYLHGSHGGMKGYWDRTRGDRTRNTCTDCHDPHAPAYPAWTPVFAPRDAAARQQAEREARHPTGHQSLYPHE